MSDIIVMDKADEAITFTGNAVTDLDGLLGGVPDLIESVGELVGDLLDHLTVSVVPSSLDLDEVLDLDDLDSSLEHVLGLVPGLVGGVLSGGAMHADGTVDVLVDQGLGISAVLNPVLEPVAEIVQQITMTLGVTDELPARLAALGGITMVGGDAVLSNLPDILDSTLGLGGLGLGLGETVDHLLTTVGSVVDELTASLGLGHLLDVVDVGLTEGPMAVEGTTDESVGAGHGLLDLLVTDAGDAAEAHPGGNLVIAVQGLVHSAPENVDQTVNLVLSDTLSVTVPEVVEHTTIGVGNLLDQDPTTLGATLGADLDHTVTGVTTFVDDTTTGLGLGLDLGGLG